MVCLLTLAAYGQSLGLVKGRVLNDDSLKPVAGAQVRIAGDGWNREVTTDINGRFVILGVPFRARYHVNASGPGGYAWGALGAVYPESPTTIEFRLYNGVSDGPCGYMLAIRDERAVAFRVPFVPATLPKICM
jgi:hypothetical protein